MEADECGIIAKDITPESVARDALTNGFTIVPPRVIEPGPFAALVAVRHTFHLSLKDAKKLVDGFAVGRP